MQVTHILPLHATHCYMQKECLVNKTKANTETSCAEQQGRKLLFEWVLQYFAAKPRLKPAPPGSACSICGSSSVPLWQSDSGTNVCLAQQTVTRKRAARITIEKAREELEEAKKKLDLTITGSKRLGEDKLQALQEAVEQAQRRLAAIGDAPYEPLIPMPDSKGKTAFSEGHFVVASEKQVALVTSIQPTVALPNHVKVIFPEKGAIKRARAELIANPPKPPFIAVNFQKASSFRIDVTVDASCIIINGDGVIIRRPHIMKCLEDLKKSGVKKPIELLRLRQRLANGEGGEKLQEEFRKVFQAGGLTMADFRRLPPPGSAEQSILDEMLSA